MISKRVSTFVTHAVKTPFYVYYMDYANTMERYDILRNEDAIIETLKILHANQNNSSYKNERECVTR